MISIPDDPAPDALDITFAIATASATHPEGIELDQDGNPIPPADDAA